MLIKTKCIVLHSLKYSDSSLIIHVFSEHLGRLSLMAKGITSSGKRNNRAPEYFRPLNLLETEISYHRDKNIHSIREVRFSYPFKSIPFDIRKSTIALFLSEVLKNTLSEEVANPSLFYWINTSIRLLDEMATGYSDFHLAFLIRFCKYLGFAPGNSYSEKEPYFDLREGLFLPTPPFHPDYLDTNLSKYFFAYLENPLGTEIKQKPGRVEINHLLEKILGYYYIHLQGLTAIRSYAILKEVFD